LDAGYCYSGSIHLEVSVDLGQYLLILNMFPVTLFIFKQEKTEFYLGPYSARTDELAHLIRDK
jgi:hypothetical protein